MNLERHDTEEAAKTMIECYDYLGTSVLLKHEMIYMVGQMNFKTSYNFLIERLNDPNEYPEARHEAAEGLANYFNVKD